MHWRRWACCISICRRRRAASGPQFRKRNAKTRELEKARGEPARARFFARDERNKLTCEVFLGRRCADPCAIHRLKLELIRKIAGKGHTGLAQDFRCLCAADARARRGGERRHRSGPIWKGLEPWLARMPNTQALPDAAVGDFPPRGAPIL